MYSRRLKLNKKKPKPTKGKQGPGSSWGPRLAIIERERQLQGGLPGDGDDDEELYGVQLIQQNLKKVKPPQQSHQKSDKGRNSDIDPVLQLGRSTSPNYFYYDYSRRAAPNQQRKISCPEPSGATRERHYAQGRVGGPPPGERQRRASYVLGSSSGYCSGSVTTLSNLGGGVTSGGGAGPQHFDQLTKPLTLIIPPQERYERRNRRYDKREEEFPGEIYSQESFPSSSAYQSSGDEDHEGRRKRHFHNPMANMKPTTVSGILQISEVAQVHPPPQQNTPSSTMEDLGETEPETLELPLDDEGGGGNDGNNNKTGSTLTALAQGITMVYVPMEAKVEEVASGNSSADSSFGEDLLPEYNEPADLPELGRQSDNDSTSSSRASASGGSKEQEDSLKSNFILKRKTSKETLQLGDSLLDSFDSILFKPKAGEALRKCQERCQIGNNYQEQKGIRKRPEQPPPLPPSNPPPGEGGKQKNLRFALENLETVLNPSRNSNSGGDSDPQQSQGPPLPPPSLAKKMLKKVTLSLPGEDRGGTMNRNHELLLNYEELNNCSSEILSCGHVRNDDYSTLSSLTSSAQEISDFDDISSNPGNRETVDLGSSSGGTESDASVGSPHQNKPRIPENIPRHEPRSVLQQLRDLSRLIRGSSPIKNEANKNAPGSTPAPPPTQPAIVHFTENNSFFLHQGANRKQPEGETKRKTSDATDNSHDSGKGSGTGSSGQEGSSSSAEPSPNNSRTGSGTDNSRVTISNGIGGSVKVKVQNNRRLKIATIRGRGGGTGPHHHYAISNNDFCDPETCSQQSSCSCGDCCGYRSDCTECRMYSKTPSGFQKPSSSEVLCSNEAGGGGLQRTNNKKGNSSSNSVPPIPPQKPSRPVSRIVRRTSSRVRAAKRTASLKRSKIPPNGHGSTRKPVILDYCDCKNCDLADNLEFDDIDDDDCCQPPRPPLRHPPEQLIIPSRSKNRNPRPSSKLGEGPTSRKISASSTSSGISSSSSAGKISRISAFRSSSSLKPSPPQPLPSSSLLRQSDAASTGSSLNPPVTIVPLPTSTPGPLFTIDEANEDSVYGESGAVIIGKHNRIPPSKIPQPRPDFLIQDSPLDSSSLEEDSTTLCQLPSQHRSRSSSHHSHPKCWLAPDATLGWSDLESLYSQNMKTDRPTPTSLRDECPTCWQELSEMKKNCPDPNRTVDRTKRMFIWLNRRHKEFHAPWWEAKKQASMRWLLTKAFAHVPKDKVPDPFKESKKGKPAKYSLRDEIVKGLISGRLYCMALDSLYRSQQNAYHLSQNLTHWEIIKILSRRGIYIAQPSDMKLTEATLRQKKPIRTAAHIALIEAMMGLYAKEILGRDRIAATLRSFGKVIDQETNSPEKLVITWINTVVTSLKSFILSSQPHLPTNKANRWLNLPEVGEIRDLCDGVGICALFALYCSNDLKVDEISVPEAGDTLTIYDSISNHSLVQKLCEDLFPEPIYHLCVTDFLYIHGCMKQNILCFLVDLFVHLEINPILRVNRLTNVPIRVEL